MNLFLEVEPNKAKGNTEGEVFADPHELKGNAIADGDVVTIASSSGQEALAKLYSSTADDAGTGYIRVNKDLRSALKVPIGDTVEITPTNVEELSEVILAPLSDVSGLDKQELAKYLKKTFLQEGRIINEQLIEYVTLPGAQTGTGFKIVESDPESGIVTDDTRVDVDFVFSTWGKTETVTFENIGGLENELQQIRELVEFPLRFPDVYQRVGINPARGVLLTGPPGNGKTLMMRAISNEIDASFHYINGPSIISTGYGESEEELRGYFDEARQSLPSIIFIDEIDAIAPKRSQTGTFADLRLVTQLMEMMDGLEATEGVMVIGTTNRINAIEPALRRPGRFDREIYIGPPDEESREEILQIHTRGMFLTEGAREYLPALAKKANGYSGADLMELVREAGVNSLRRQIGDSWDSIERGDVSLTDISIEERDFDHAKSVVQPSILREGVSISSGVTWGQVGGLSEPKDKLTEYILVPQKNQDVFASMNLEMPPGILLHGPSGTGKTLLAKAIGSEFDGTFIQIESAEIFSQWLGESVNSLKRVFQIARQAAPSLILIDDLDSVAGIRNEGGQSDVANRITNQLLSELDSISDNREITLLGTTNRLDLLDDALLSENRFGERIQVSYPDEDDRFEILKVHLKDVPTTMEDEGLRELASRTDGLSGAQLKGLCRRAKLIAIREENYKTSTEIHMEHLTSQLE